MAVGASDELLPLDDNAPPQEDPLAMLDRLGIPPLPAGSGPPPAQPGLAGFDVDAAARNLASVGQPPPPSGPGLAGFDVNAAAQNLANVGKPTPALPSTAVPNPTPTPTSPQGPQPSKLLPGMSQVTTAKQLSPEQQANRLTQQQNETDIENTIKRGGALKEETAGINSAMADAEAEHRAQHAERMNQAINLGNDYINEARNAYQRRVRERSAMQLKDPRDDMGFGSKALAALGLVFGALGAGIRAAGGGSGHNDALDVFQERVRQDIDRQKFNIGRADDAVVMARTGINDAQQAKAALIADVDANEGAAWKTVEAKFRKQLADQGVPAAQIDTDSRVAYARKQQLEAEQRALAPTIEDVKTTLTNMGKAGKVGRGGGGGGSGGKGMAELVKMKEDGQPDSAISARAAELHIPPGGKNGYLGVIRGVQATQRQGLQGERQVTKEAESWAKQNELEKINKTQRELTSLTKVLHDNPNNPEAQALAVEKAVSAARGGAASRQALSLALEHLGGTLDNADAFIQKVRSGAMGTKQMENFLGFLNGQLGAAQAEGKEKYDAFNEYIDSQTDPKVKEGLLASRGRLFSGLSGFGGKSAGAAPTGNAPPGSKAGKLADGRKVFKYPDGTVHLPDGTLVP